jgi:hypothetical protein
VRRKISVFALATALFVVSAAPAYAAHCTNRSKPDGAGNHGFIVVDAVTEEIVFASEDALHGGFIDVWVDVTGDAEGEFLAVEDTFIAKNHSPMHVGDPFVVPGAFHNPGDNGVGF